MLRRPRSVVARIILMIIEMRLIRTLSLGCFFRPIRNLILLYSARFLEVIPAK